MDKDIVERLEAVESSRKHGYGTGAADIVTTWYRNPDGPEAAAEILALRERLAEVEGALGPFAKALNDWGDDTSQPDRWNTWEHPIAMNVTLGDFRRARTILQPSTKENGE